MIDYAMLGIVLYCIICYNNMEFRHINILFYIFCIEFIKIFIHVFY